MNRLRSSLAAILLCGLACTGLAAEEGVRERVKEAVAAGDVAAAEAVLESVWSADDSSTTDLVEGLEAADTFLPPGAALRHRASLAARLVTDPPTDSRVWESVWSTAMELRHQVVDEVELEGGRRLLEAVRAALPNDPRPLEDLAELNYDAGRSEDARRLYEELEKMVPGRTRAVFRLARLAEYRGDVARALEWYDYLIDLARDTDDVEIDYEALYAYQSKVQLLSDKFAADAAAQATLDEWERVLAEVPPGAERDRSEATHERVAQDVADNAARRRALREIRASVRTKNLWITGVWVLLIGGGVLLLRRRGLL